MQRKQEAPEPGSWRGRATGRSAASAQLHSNIAFVKRKHGRDCIVCKITTFTNSETPVLAVAWRGQRGTETAVSIPERVLDIAAQHGVTDFYLRDDRRMTMLTCSLDLFKHAKLHRDGERYVLLHWLQPVQWRDWHYCEDVLVLEDEQSNVQQLSFFEPAREAQQCF